MTIRRVFVQMRLRLILSRTWLTQELQDSILELNCHRRIRVLLGQLIEAHAAIVTGTWAALGQLAQVAMMIVETLKTEIASIIAACGDVGSEFEFIAVVTAFCDAD
ncbi:MAG: hypothetical protein WBV94_02715 [Blastocatellia bacterium]